MMRTFFTPLFTAGILALLGALLPVASTVARAETPAAIGRTVTFAPAPGEGRIRPAPRTPSQIRSVQNKNEAAWTEVSGNFPGTIGLFRRLNPRGLPPGHAELQVLLPEQAPPDLSVILFVKNKDGLWFQQTGTGLNLDVRGVWQTVGFDLGTEDGRMQPRDQMGHWDGLQARHVSDIGMLFHSATPVSGRIGVRELRIAPPPTPPLVLHQMEWLPGSRESYVPQELAFALAGYNGNPFDAAQITVDAVITGPDGVAFTRPAFYYQDYHRSLEGDREILTPTGRAGWRLRFTPLLPGAYRWRLDVRAGDRKVTTAEHVLTVAAGTPRDFARVSPKDPRFFETADGAFFYPVGEHIQTPFDRRSGDTINLPMPPEQGTRGTYTYDYYFRKMQECGANFEVMWMCNWWVAIEWSSRWKDYFGANDYNLANAWRVDYLLDQAAANGIHLLMVIDNHGKFSTFVDEEWDGNPLSQSQGGPCRTPEDAYSSDEAARQYRNRIRYLMARWGEHPHLFGWEVMSELDLVGNNWNSRNRPERTTWLSSLCDTIRSIDRLRRPLTVQYSGDWRVVEREVAALPAIDFISSDGYKQDGHADALLAPIFQNTYANLNAYGKPAFIIEYGGDWRGSTPEQLLSDFHIGLWANLMQPLGAAPCFWWYYFIDQQNLYPQFTAVNKFIAGDDPRGVAWRTDELPAVRNGQPAGNLRCLAMTGPDRGRAWVFDAASQYSLEDARNTPHPEITVTAAGLKPGAYRLTFFDTFTGDVIHRAEARADDGGRLVIHFPDFRIDCAVKFQRAE